MLELDTHEHKKLSHTIVTLYWVTMLVVAVGTGLALYKNWIAQLETTQINLVRNANIGNVLVESALLSANKTLRNTRNQLELELLKGTPSNQAVQKLLMNAASASDAYNKSYELGMMFLVDSSGLVYASSDRHQIYPSDVADRFYFNDLKSNFKKKTTVGPLLKADNTEQWVFHMAVPVHDSTGNFPFLLLWQMMCFPLSWPLDDLMLPFFGHHLPESFLLLRYS